MARNVNFDVTVGDGASRPTARVTSAVERLADRLEQAAKAAGAETVAMDAAAQAEDRVGDQAAGTREQLVGLATAQQTTAAAADHAADQLDEEARAAARLEAAIEATRRRHKELISEFANSGNADAMAEAKREGALLRQLERMRKDLEGTKKAAKDAGEAIGGALEDAAEKGGKALAGNLGKGMTDGLSAAARAAGEQAPIIAAMLAPAIGAGISAGALSVIGGGALTAGLVAAINNDQVVSAGQAIVDDLQQEWSRVGSAFAGPVLASMGTLQATLRHLDLAGMLQPMTAAVGPMVRGLSEMLDRLGPGLRNAIAASEPVVEVLAGKLPVLGTAIGNLLDRLAGSSDGAADFLARLIDETALFIEASGYVIQGLTTVYGWLEKIAEKGTGFPLVDIVGKLLGSSGNSDGERVGKIVALGGAIDTTSSSANKLALASAAAAQQLMTWTEAIDRLNGKAVTSRQAVSAYEAAIDAATEAIKNNGRTLDLHTEKGRANDSALQQIRSATVALTQATYDETNASNGASAAADAASRSWDQGKEAYVRTAQKMGMTKQQAQELADRMMQRPQDWDLKAGISGVSTVLESLAAIRRAVANTTGKVDVGAGSAVTYAEYYYGKRAGGGPVEAGLPYLVGEEGQELFVPKTPGTIIPAGQTDRMLAGGGYTPVPGLAAAAGATITIQVTVNAGLGVNGAALGAEVGAGIVDAIAAYEQTNGTGWRDSKRP